MFHTNPANAKPSEKLFFKVHEHMYRNQVMPQITFPLLTLTETQSQLNKNQFNKKSHITQQQLNRNLLCPKPVARE